MKIRRRGLLRSGLALPLAGAAPAAVGPSVYQRLGVPTFINAYGTLTTLGGTLMEPEVLAAMNEAAGHFVAIHDLQKRVGERLAELTGAEAGFVTAGASCAICFGDLRGDGGRGCGEDPAAAGLDGIEDGDRYAEGAYGGGEPV